MDVVKICEVVDGCEDCPKYGDDCDGRGDAEMLNEDFRPKYMQQSRHDDGKDLISRADAIDACCRGWNNTAEDCIRNIKALPSAELSKGELVSKADVIDAVCRTRCGDKAKGCPAHSCLVIEEFDALLSADAVQAEWQKVEEQPYFRKHYDTVCCSVCRKKGNRKWNFCPNCGARMKGGAE